MILIRSYPMPRRTAAAGWFAVIQFWSLIASAQSPNALPSPAPDLGFSILRLISALIFVIALFLGGVWLFRNWQRLRFSKRALPMLNILEVKSLGGRHALYVVGYERERLLIGSSPGGINLLTHLPGGDAEPTATSTAGAAFGSPGETPQPFPQRLQAALSRSNRRKAAG
jgi:flagellar biogenesis protein FliO